MGLNVSDCDSGTLEIWIREKWARIGVSYAEGGSDRAWNGWRLRLRGGVAGPLMLPLNKGGRVVYGGRRDACSGVNLQHVYAGP